VLPEVVMPTAGRVAAFVIAPFTDDYLQAVALTSAALLALLAAGLYASLCRLFLSLRQSQARAVLLGGLVIGLFFAMFKRQPADNPHMLLSLDLCSTFFYAVPNLLNSILICEFFRWFVLRREVSVRGSMASVLWMTALYMGIFSMQFAAMFLTVALTWLAVFRFAALPTETVAQIGQGGWWRRFWRDAWARCNVSVIATLGMAVALLCELTGGRARDMGLNSFSGSMFSSEFVVQMGVSAGHMWTLLLGMNPFMAAMVFGLILLAAGLYARRRKQDSRSELAVLARVCIASAVLLLPYYDLVTARSNPQLIRIDVMYGFFFFVILLSALSALYVLEHVRASRWLLPLAVLTVLLTATNSRWTLADPFAHGQRASLDACIQQIVAADQAGDTSITLPRPPFMANWTQSTEEWSQLFARTLFLHRVTSRPMTITFSLPVGENEPLVRGQSATSH
jgi:hypothetical protein